MELGEIRLIAEQPRLNPGARVRKRMTQGSVSMHGVRGDLVWSELDAKWLTRLWLGSLAAANSGFALRQRSGVPLRGTALLRRDGYPSHFTMPLSGMEGSPETLTLAGVFRIKS